MVVIRLNGSLVWLKRNSISCSGRLHYVSDFICVGVSVYNEFYQLLKSPVGYGCRIHRLYLCIGVRLPRTSVLIMTLKYLMVRLQFRSFEEFTIITTWFTLTWSGSTCQDPIYASNRNIQSFSIIVLFTCVQTNDRCWIKLFVLHINTWNHLTVSKRMNNLEYSY